MTLPNPKAAPKRMRPPDYPTLLNVAEYIRNHAAEYGWPERFDTWKTFAENSFTLSDFYNAVQELEYYYMVTLTNEDLAYATSPERLANRIQERYQDPPR